MAIRETPPSGQVKAKLRVCGDYLVTVSPQLEGGTSSSFTTLKKIDKQIGWHWHDHQSSQTSTAVKSLATNVILLGLRVKFDIRLIQSSNISRF